MSSQKYFWTLLVFTYIASFLRGNSFDDNELEKQVTRSRDEFEDNSRPFVEHFNNPSLPTLSSSLTAESENDVPDNHGNTMEELQNQEYFPAYAPESIDVTLNKIINIPQNFAESNRTLSGNLSPQLEATSDTNLEKNLEIQTFYDFAGNAGGRTNKFITNLLDDRHVSINDESLYDQPHGSHLNESIIDALKIVFSKEILKRLGMTSIPEMSKANMSIHERREILRLYKKSMEEIKEKTSSSALFDDDSFYASQFHSYNDNGTRHEVHTDPGMFNSKKWILFSIDLREPSDHNKETLVDSATLKLYKAYVKPELIISNDFVDRSVRIDILQIIGDIDQDEPSSIRFLRRSVASRLVSLDSLDWEEFDVSRAAQDWIRDPSSNYGLEVACDSRYNMDDLIHFVVWNETMLVERSSNPTFAFSATFHNNSYDSTFWPVLNVLTQEKPILHSRFKRSSNVHSDSDGNFKNSDDNSPDDCTLGGGETRCCRYPLYVSFRDIGWDSWVIEPEGYLTHYCFGDCPTGYKLANKYASLISTVIAKKDAGNEEHARLSLKCVTSEFGSLSIAHLNEQGYSVVSVLKNMIPLKCHCL